MPNFVINKNKSYIPVILFFLAGILWRTAYYKFSLYVAIPFIIIYCIISYGKAISKFKYTYLYLFVVFWMFLSALINLNTDKSLREMVPIVGSCFLALSVYSIAYKNQNSKIIFISYVALFAFLMYRNATSEGFTSDFNYANELERMNNFVLNANDFAYYSLFAIMSVRLFILTLKKNIRPLYLIIIYAMCVAVSFYVALMTASRQVLLLQIPLILSFIYIDFIKKGGNKKNVILFVTLIGLVLLFPIVVSIYNNSYLATRSEVSFSEDVRSLIILIALEEGLSNPIFGLGLVADTSFSHCTYTHLLSRCGFPAAIAFTIIVCKAMLEEFKRYKKTKNTNFLIYFVCVGIISVGHITYSYIDEPFLMAIMFAIIGISDKEYKLITSRINN